MSLEGFKLNDLRGLAAELGLGKTGTKADLIQKITQKHAEKVSDKSEAEADVKKWADKVLTQGDLAQEIDSLLRNDGPDATNGAEAADGADATDAADEGEAEATGDVDFEADADEPAEQEAHPVGEEAEVGDEVAETEDQKKELRKKRFAGYDSEPAAKKQKLYNHDFMAQAKQAGLFIPKEEEGDQDKRATRAARWAHITAAEEEEKQQKVADKEAEKSATEAAKDHRRQRFAGYFEKEDEEKAAAAAAAAAKATKTAQPKPTGPQAPQTPRARLAAQGINVVKENLKKHMDLPKEGTPEYFEKQKQELEKLHKRREKFAGFSATGAAEA